MAVIHHSYRSHSVGDLLFFWFQADTRVTGIQFTMKLRNHPKMTWQGRPNWPPIWHGPYGPDKPLPEGEVGVLRAFEKSILSAGACCCLLTVAHNGQDYFGSLSFDDEEFSQKVCAILSDHIGEPISAIGSLDIP